MVLIGYIFVIVISHPLDNCGIGISINFLDLIQQLNPQIYW